MALKLDTTSRGLSCSSFGVPLMLFTQHGLPAPSLPIATGILTQARPSPQSFVQQIININRKDGYAEASQFGVTTRITKAEIDNLYGLGSFDNKDFEGYIKDLLTSALKEKIDKLSDERLREATECKSSLTSVSSRGDFMQEAQGTYNQFDYSDGGFFGYFERDPYSKGRGNACALIAAAYAVEFFKNDGRCDLDPIIKEGLLNYCKYQENGGGGFVETHFAPDFYPELEKLRYDGKNISQSWQYDITNAQEIINQMINTFYNSPTISEHFRKNGKIGGLLTIGAFTYFMGFKKNEQGSLEIYFFDSHGKFREGQSRTPSYVYKFLNLDAFKNFLIERSLMHLEKGVPKQVGFCMMGAQSLGSQASRSLARQQDGGALNFDKSTCLKYILVLLAAAIIVNYLGVL